MQQYTKDLGTAPLMKLLLRLSVPGMLSMITLSLYNTVDTFWVAKLGYQAMTSLTIVMPYQWVFHAIGGGTGIGVTALVSRLFGQNRIEETNRVAGQVFSLSIFWGFLFLLITFLFSDAILPALGATPDILELSKEYMLFTSFGATQIIFVVIIGNLIRGSGDAVKPMILMIGAAVLNMILDPFMILGIGPFPEMGIRGAALATTISQTAGAVFGLYYFFSRKTSFHIKPAYLVPDFKLLKEIYRIGAPAALLQVTEVVSFTLFNRLLSGYGSQTIAAVGLPMRISDLVFVPLMGASNGLLPIIGYNFGAKNYRRLWDAVKKATIVVVILLAIITAGVELFAPEILGIFTQDEQVLDTAVPALRIMLAGTLFIGPTLLFVTVFQGLSQGTKALITSLLRQFIVFIPLLYLFSFLFGLDGILWTLPGSDTLSFILTGAFIWWEYRKQSKMYKFTEQSGESVESGT
ncbi:MAG: MATE family efflux transporter [Dehalococcoidales bacterium]|nr:MATE family efflux transporter [Dehalococcoidales bacterium]